jgi:hypothetical protein
MPDGGRQGGCRQHDGQHGAARAVRDTAGVGAVARNIGAEAPVAVRTEHPDRPELRFQLRGERPHRRVDGGGVAVSVQFPELAGVVGLDLGEERRGVCGPAGERGHAVLLTVGFR